MYRGMLYRMKVLLIIPAYNEAESLPSLLTELQDYPQYDIVVINDCSQDDTAAVAREFNVPCVSLPVNLGLSGGVQTGFLYAEENGYDVCVQIDGDGQHIPEEIAKLIGKIEAGYDIAIGSRFLDNTGKYEQSLLRGLGAKYISFLIRVFSGLKLTDPTSGMRAFERGIFTKMADATNERPEPDTILAYARRKKKIVEIQVDMRERTAGESYLTLPHAIRYMIENTLSCFYVVFKVRRKRG